MFAVRCHTALAHLFTVSRPVDGQVLSATGHSSSLSMRWVADRCVCVLARASHQLTHTHTPIRTPFPSYMAGTVSGSPVHPAAVGPAGEDDSVSLADAEVFVCWRGEDLLQDFSWISVDSCGHAVNLDYSFFLYIFE